MRISVLIFILVLGQVSASPREKRQGDVYSKIRSPKYNVIVSHRRLGDCTYDLTFLRGDNTAANLRDLLIYYAVDDTEYKTPIITGSVSLPLDKAMTTVNWKAPADFIAPYDVTGVTDAGGDDAGTVEQHTMADGICTPASTKGDPHLRSFDGHGYGFQGLCWYTLAKHCTQYPDFKIEAEFAPRETPDPEMKTRTVRLNVTVGDEMLSMNTDNEITVNGRPLWAAKLFGLPKNFDLVADETRVSIKIEQYNLDILWDGRHHAFSAAINHPDYNGNVCGLLGNADGNPLNDFQMPDGGLTRDVNEFGESWAINDTGCYY